MNEQQRNQYGKSNQEKEEKYYNIKFEEVEDIEADIPADPSPELIKKLIGELPSQIEYLENKAIEIKKKMQDMKLIVRARKAAIELQKSRIRQEYVEKYQKELKKYIEDCKNFLEDPTLQKLSKTERADMIKTLKPEKPTKNDLDDIANLRTEEAQREVFKLEKAFIALEEQYELTMTKVKKYENKNLAARAHARIIEQDLKRY